MSRRSTAGIDRNTAIDLVASSAIVLLALTAFHSSYGGIEYLLVGAVGVLLGVTSTYIGYRLRWPVIAIVALWVVVYGVVGGAVALRDRAALGFLPSPSGTAAALTAAITGWKQLLTTVPPVGSTGDLLALPMLMGIVATGAALLLAVRTRLRIVPVLPAVVVLALGVLCGTNEPVSVIVHGGIFAVITVAWGALRHRRSVEHVDLGHGRTRRVVAAATVLVVAAAAGLAVSDAVPLVSADDRLIWRDTTEPPFDPNEFPSPLASYRRYVKLLSDDVLFTVEGLPAGTPIRMTTLDAYDGVVWRLEGGARARPGGAAYFERVGTDVAPSFPGEEVDVTITIPDGSAYREVWVPSVGEVRSITFHGERGRQLAEAFRYNRPTGTSALSRLGLQAGDSYTMRVVLPTRLDEVPMDATVLDRSLPEIQFIGSQLGGLGSGLLENESLPVRRVRLLAQYLTDVGYYSDGNEDQPPSRAGHGVGRLEIFATADALVGNAEQYAASLGLMLRNQQIPARVVMGFITSSMEADGPTEITGTMAEAWVEVPIDGVGWAHIEATPNRDKTTIEVTRAPRPIPDRETQVPPPPIALEPDAETDPASESDQPDRDDLDDEEEDEEEEDEERELSILTLLLLIGGGFPLLVLGVPAAVIMLVKLMRRRRRRRRGPPEQRIVNGWRELVDFSIDAGHPISPTATRREIAQFVGTGSPPALARSADAAVFGPFDPTDSDVDAYWAELSATLRELRRELAFLDRVRCRVSTASLRRRLDRPDRRT